MCLRSPAPEVVDWIGDEYNAITATAHVALRPDQLRLADQLSRLRLPDSATLYRDACRLMDAPESLASTSHLVAHLLREVESSLRQVIKPIVEIGAQPDGVKAHAWEIDAISTAIDPDGELAGSWKRFVGLTSEISLAGRAHRNDLGPVRPVDDTFRAFWEEAEFFLSRIVDAVERSFHLVLDRLREIASTDAPTVDDAVALTRSLLQSDAALAIFFEELAEPAWIPPLIEAGLFSMPPDRVYDADERSTWYPAWSASRFLRRASAEDGWSEEVLATAIVAVPPTNNQRVVGDLVTAAKQLPAALIAEWARTWLARDVLGTLDGALHFNYFADISGLAAHLAREGEADAALDLVRALYRLTPPPEPDPEAFWSSRDPGMLASSSFYYHHGLRDDLPTVAAAAPWDVLTLLADQVDAYTRWTTEDAASDDGSEHWLDDVGEDDDGSSMYETGAWLARALCRTALGMVAADQATASEVVAWLLGRERHVYLRCALTVAREHGTPADVAALLSDRDRLFDEPVQEETVRLIEARVRDLPDEDRCGVLDRLEAGPRAEFYAERAETNGWPEVAPEQAQKWAHEVRSRVLGRLRPVLPEAWVAKHGDLFPTEAEPEPTPPDPAMATLAGLGNLLASDPEAGMRQLATWASIEHPPNLEAIAYSLERAVRADRAGFSSVADALIGADATVVRGLVNGLSEREDGADEDPEAIEWEPVLRLLTWAARQPYAIPGRTGRDRDGDPNWGWAWKRIAGMLDRALRANEIEWDLRDLVWQALHPLTDAPDPEPGDPGDTGRGAYSHAINSTRGDAMSAVFGYVAWAQWATGDAPNAVSEAFGVLDAHLDPEVDPSPAIRAIYGKNIPLLMWAAGPWLRERRDLLFPDIEPLRLGVWDGYGYTQRRADDVIEFLRPVYLAELNRVGDGTIVEVLYPDEPFLRQERVRGEVRQWAVQIADAYLLGVVGLDEGDLGAALFGHPSSEVRALAVRQVGRLFRESWGGHAPGVVGDRAVEAWEWMRGRFELTADVGEAFASWAPIHGLDPAWSLPHLVEALGVSRGETREGYRLIEWLAGDAGHDPALAVRVLDLLVQAERGHLYGQEAEMRMILRRAAKAGGEARALARQAVNRVLVRSHVDLGDALVEPGTDGE